MKLRNLLVTVGICFITLLTLTVTSHAAYINGDVNNDGIHSTTDARLALMFASGIITPNSNEELAADINHNGYVTTSDATEILRVATSHKEAPRHKYTAWSVTQTPTCTENGSATSSCETCKKTFTKVLLATGHEYTALTCTQDGACKHCGKTIAAKGHIFINNTCVVCGFSSVDPYVTYQSKTIVFNATATAVKNILGKPQDILTDTTEHGSLTIYVYCSDYSNLGIFTFFNNRLTQFYTNNQNASVAHKTNRFTLTGASVSDTYFSVGDITLTTYVDNATNDDAYVYSYLATVGNSYEFFDTSTFTANEKLVFHLVNGCRGIHGKTPLTYSSKAHKSAYKHSADMAANDYFDHTGLNGSSPGDRMSDAGIDWRRCAENIAAGYRDAYELNDGWYNSSGHRSNMLNQQLENVGIGIAYNSSSIYGYFATENFYT